MGSPRLTEPTELTCNTNAGMVQLSNVTNPYNAELLGENNAVKCLPQVEGCYTLMLSDDDGDIVIENGCHDPGLNFSPACECTGTGGYICWSMCQTANCNSQVDLHEEMVSKCALDGGNGGGGDNDGSDAASTSLCALLLLSFLN